MVTRYSFGAVIERLLFLNNNNNETFKKWRHDFQQILRSDLRSHLPLFLPACTTDPSSPEGETRTPAVCSSFHPYFDQYSRFLVRCNLRLLVRRDGYDIEDFENLVVSLLPLNCDGGDAQLEVLRFLRSLASGSCRWKDSRHDETPDDATGVADDGCDDEEVPEVLEFDACSGMEKFLTEKIVDSLISLVAGDDVFHLNLTQALHCLIEVMKLSTNDDVAVDIVKEERALQLFNTSLKLASESTFIEVQEKAIYLAAYLCKSLFEEKRTNCRQVEDENISSLMKFCDIVNRKALSELSNHGLKLATAFALALNFNVLLVDQRCQLGCTLFDNWTSLVQLSQEEDLRIRRTSVSFVPLVRLQHQTLRYSGRTTCLNPTFGARVLLEIFFYLHCLWNDSYWSAKAFHVISNWLTNDPVERQKNQEVRLFDRGQLNPYLDEIRVTLMIRNTTELLVDRVLKSCGSISISGDRKERRCSLESRGGVCRSCSDAEAWKEPKKFESRLNDLARETDSLRRRLETTGTTEAFARQSSLGAMIVAFARKSSALHLMEAFLKERRPSTAQRCKDSAGNLFDHVQYLVMDSRLDF